MRALLVFVVAIAVVGCESQIPESERTPLGGPATTSDALTGTVLEQHPAGSYVYLRLKTTSGETWAAVSAAPIKTGSQVTIGSATLMKNFEAPSLKRTFPEIWFGEVAPSGMAMSASGANPHATVAASTGDIDVGRVEKATGADARTVAETWSERTALNGKTVTIRGVVVKVNENVMGKNWIHIRDGSGDASQGTNDLTVTSLDKVAVGETVTITGTVRTNRDVGAGYSYAVLVEEARVARR
ncbi:MAG TPA: hypothetical protein VFZ73_00240 [Gemmatimonadaceae bacterium]